MGCQRERNQASYDRFQIPNCVVINDLRARGNTLTSFSGKISTEDNFISSQVSKHIFFKGVCGWLCVWPGSSSQRVHDCAKSNKKMCIFSFFFFFG